MEAEGAGTAAASQAVALVMEARRRPEMGAEEERGAKEAGEKKREERERERERGKKGVSSAHCTTQHPPFSPSGLSSTMTSFCPAFFAVSYAVAPPFGPLSLMSVFAPCVNR